MDFDWPLAKVHSFPEVTQQNFTNHIIIDWLLIVFPEVENVITFKVLLKS